MLSCFNKYFIVPFTGLYLHSRCNVKAHTEITFVSKSNQNAILISDGVKSCAQIKGATNAEIEGAARGWLLHASDRLRQSQKKKAQRANEDEGESSST